MVTDETMPRRAIPSDSDVMAAIHAAAFPDPDAWGRDVFRQQLGLPNVFGLLHPSGGLILVRVAADEAEILTLAVAPAARRGGIGRMLLHKAAITAGFMGAAAIFLEVSVLNSAARAAYAQAGYKPVGRRPEYYSDRSDALVLRFDIGDSR